MKTQNIKKAGGGETKPAPKAGWGYALRTHRPQADDAWWQTVTHYIPAPWHPATSVAFGCRETPNSEPHERWRAA
jgi:hypothetical protein